MRGEDEKRWKELAAQAVTEEDSDQFLVLIRELNDMLERKRSRLESAQKTQANPTDK
jgi:hypothetical protein